MIEAPQKQVLRRKLSPLSNAKDGSSNIRTPGTSVYIGHPASLETKILLLYCNIIPISYLLCIVTCVSKLHRHSVHPGFRNFEVTLCKNVLRGGNILRENGVRNKESTRKYVHAALVCSVFCWEGRREPGQEKARCRLQGSVWLGGRVTSGSAACAS